MRWKDFYDRLNMENMKDINNQHDTIGGLQAWVQAGAQHQTGFFTVISKY